jgi:hypothetical protein
VSLAALDPRPRDRVREGRIAAVGAEVEAEGEWSLTPPIFTVAVHVVLFFDRLRSVDLSRSRLLSVGRRADAGIGFHVDLGLVLDASSE